MGEPVIAMVRGRLVAGEAGQVVVDVGGVGYQVQVIPGDVGSSLGEEITLHTHLAVREDALTLYGFRSWGAVSLFRQLVTVSGVGPRLALAAIGTLGPEGLRRAVVTEDVAALIAIPGVGKKSAQRLVLELRERLGSLGVSDLPAMQSTTTDARAEVRAALGSLGYGAGEIEAALASVPGDAPAEVQLKDALRGLGTGR